ncbi:MAG: hypothetical protein ACK5WY_00635 [Holosporaceae bacterium]|jgi:hypothetical protein|nr:hypothetical protein [Rhodospirillaceae bacterium]
MKAKFSRSLQANRRNRTILVALVAVLAVGAVGVGGTYAAKQARIGVLRKQMAALPAPLALNYVKSDYSPWSGVLTLQQVTVSPLAKDAAATPSSPAADDSLWTMGTLRLEPLSGGLARAGRVSLLDNRIGNGFWSALNFVPKDGAAADAAQAGSATAKSMDGKTLAVVKSWVFGDAPLAGNASWSYQMDKGAQQITLSDVLFENADGRLSLDQYQLDSAVTSNAGTAAVAVQLNNLRYASGDDVAAIEGATGEESQGTDGQGATNDQSDGQAEGQVMGKTPPSAEKDDPVKSLLKAGVSFKAVVSEPDMNTKITENLTLVAGPTVDSGTPFVVIDSITAVKKAAATNGGVEEASSTIKGLALAFEAVPGLADIPQEESLKKLTMDIMSKGTLDTNSQVGNYQFELGVRNQFGLNLQISLGNLSPQLTDKLQEMQLAGDNNNLQEVIGQVMGISLNQASVTYDDKSLLRLLINDAARERGLSVDQWVSQLSEKPNVLMARGKLPLLQQQWPAIEQFLRSPGTLSVALKPAAPTTFAAIAMQQQSGGNQALVEALGLQLVATPASLVEQQALPGAEPIPQQPATGAPAAPAGTAPVTAAPAAPAAPAASKPATAAPAPAPAAAPKANGGKTP